MTTTHRLYWGESVTPSTERVRAMVVHGIPRGEPYTTEAGQQFDRWLLQHDRETRSTATRLALREAARVLAAEFTPLVQRQPDWRTVYARLIDAAAFGDVTRTQADEPMDSKRTALIQLPSSPDTQQEPE